MECSIKRSDQKRVRIPHLSTLQPAERACANEHLVRHRPAVLSPMFNKWPKHVSTPPRGTTPSWRSARWFPARLARIMMKFGRSGQTML